MRGVDVSEWQGTIDWARVAKAGIGFGIARVSDGLQHPDPYFSRNWRGMKANGLVRGVYQFFRPGQDPARQADLLLAHVGVFGPGDIPPVLDVEVTDGTSSAHIAAGIAAWIARIESKTGIAPLVYTSPGFASAHGLRRTGNAGLWVAHWGVSSPRVPSGWPDWTFWQTTSHDSVAGIHGRVDGDLFHGTLADLRAYAARTGAAKPPHASP